MENKFAWSFLGFLMAVIFGFITLYLGFVKENKPDLNYVVTADSSVLDIKEQLGSLDVLYEGESLSKRKQDLRFITFKVINQGNSSILSNFYDSNFPIGFNVKNGEMADEPKLLSASNNYLEDKLVTTMNTKTNVSFSNVILEPNEFFEIKILVLHEVGKVPTIEAFGKIATIDKIEVLRNFSSVSELSFIEKTFGGGVLTNVFRLIAYGFMFIFVILVLVAVGEKNNNRKELKRKRKLVKTFKDYDSDKITEKDDFFFDYYISRDVMKLKKIQSIMSNPSELVDEDKKLSFDSNSSVRDRLLYSELKNEGLIKIEGNNHVIDEQRFSVLTDFVNYLKRKGEFKRNKYYVDDVEDLRCKIEKSEVINSESV